MRQTCCCTLFVVCRQFQRGRRFFFSMKKFFVFVDETATPTQILRTAYGEKPVRETWRTPFIDYSPYVVFSSFRPYFAVVCEQCIAGFNNKNLHCKNEFFVFGVEVHIENVFITFQYFMLLTLRDVGMQCKSCFPKTISSLQSSTV